MDLNNFTKKYPKTIIIGIRHVLTSKDANPKKPPKANLTSDCGLQSAILQLSIRESHKRRPSLSRLVPAAKYPIPAS